MLREKIAQYSNRLADKEEHLEELLSQKNQLEKNFTSQEDSEEMIELQIKSTKLNIQLVDLRSDVILEKNISKRRRNS